MIRRVALGVAALSLPLATVPMAAIAGAGTGGASTPVSCIKLSGNIARTLFFTGCGDGLGRGTAFGSLFPAGGGTITWTGKNKGTTTVGKVTFASPGRGGCKKGSVEQDVTGTVTRNTSKARIRGTKLSARVCVDNAGNQSLVKNTTLTL